MILNGLFYTAMSRVKRGEHFFIRKFLEKSVKANPLVEQKKAAMEICSRYQFKKVYLDEDICESKEEIKIGYLNIQGLIKGKSLEFVNNDNNLKELHYLVIAETWLTVSTSDAFLTNQLSNWVVHTRSDAEDGLKHMGLLVLQGQSTSGRITMRILNNLRWSKKKSVYAQILQVHFDEYLLEASFVYINKTPTDTEVTNLCDVCKQSKLIVGDLNLDYARVVDQKKLADICGGKRVRILNELTTNQHSQLDHILLDTTIWRDHFSTSYYNYTSDHKAVTVRLPNFLKNNKISKKFKQRLHFDQSKETVIGVKRKAQACSQSLKRQKPDMTSRKRKSDEINELNRSAKTPRIVPVREVLPVLSEEMLNVIKECFKQSNETIVAAQFGWHVNRREMTCLLGLNWLNSDIIEIMFRMIDNSDASTLAMSFNFTQFLRNGQNDAAKQCTDRINVLGFKKVIMPVNTGDHWSCAAIDIEKKQIYYYDSLRRENHVRQLRLIIMIN